MPTSSIVYRPTVSAWLVLVAAALALFFVVDAAARGFLSIAVITGAWSLLLVAILALFLFVPCVRADDSGLTIVNPFVTTSIPWPVISELSGRFQLVVRVSDGRQFKAFGVPRQSARARAIGKHDMADEIEILRRENSSVRKTSASVASRTHGAYIITLAIITVLAVALTVAL